MSNRHPSRISTVMETKMSPWTFATIVTILATVFMLSASFLLFVLMVDHPEPRVRAAVIAMVGSSILTAVILVANAFFQNRAVKALIKRLHAALANQQDPSELRHV